MNRLHGVPFRRVVRTDFYTNKYCRPGEGSMSHTLECGHVNWTKQSYGNPARMRCRECANAARGT